MRGSAPDLPQAAEGDGSAAPMEVASEQGDWGAVSIASFDHLEGRTERREDGALAFQLYSVSTDGEAVPVHVEEARRLPLRAGEGEPQWQCTGCRSKGWSQARTRVCVQCLAQAPMAAAELEEQKHTLRKQG